MAKELVFWQKVNYDSVLVLLLLEDCERTNTRVCIIFRESSVSKGEFYLENEDDRNAQGWSLGYEGICWYCTLGWKDRMEFLGRKGNSGKLDWIKTYKKKVRINGISFNHFCCPNSLLPIFSWSITFLVNKVLPSSCGKVPEIGDNTIYTRP